MYQIREISAEELAQRLHVAQQTLNPNFFPDAFNHIKWEDVPPRQKEFLIESCKVVLDELLAEMTQAARG